jgi:hypothetical protein
MFMAQNSRILVEDVRGAAFTGKSRLRERLSREIARRKQSSDYLFKQLRKRVTSWVFGIGLPSRKP